MSEDDFKIPSAAIKVSKLANEFEKVTSSSVSSTGNVNKERAQGCSYREPKWSQRPSTDLSYYFEVLKSGSIIEKIEKLEEKCYWVFGRLPDCNIIMAHPTISRYHAVLQYKGSTSKSESENENECGRGWYIYDLGSTHGTFLNKLKVPPKTYIPVKVGHIIRLGASTRNYILQGPEFDQEPESQFTITELKELKLQEEERKKQEDDLQEKLREKEGINWGMAEDADEETDLTINPYASTNNEELFLNDPKKTLRGFFEREGLELEYNVFEMSTGTFVCRILLPIDDTNGKSLVAEVCHKGKKKDCVVQCALEACRILDRHGILRQSYHEPLKRKAPTKYSDDEDDFLDRTGDIERKKQKKAAGSQNLTLTYDDLVKQEEEILSKIASVEENILKYQELSKRCKNRMETLEDDLDAFMTNLSEDSKFDKTEIRKLRVDQQRLKTEQQKLQRLIRIAKPTDLPSIKSSNEPSKTKPLLSLFGKRNKTKFVIPRIKKKEKFVEKELKSDEEEVEECEEEESKVTKENEVVVSSKAYNTVTTSIKNMFTEEKNDVKTETKRIFGPAFTPSDILQSMSTVQPLEGGENVKEKNSENMCSDQIKEDSNATKKKRTRIRIRGKVRENVDIDDRIELQDTEKYSGWIPPQDQTGDGITSLNKKFGY